jgi:hypothetical protein
VLMDVVADGADMYTRRSSPERGAQPCAPASAPADRRRGGDASRVEPGRARAGAVRCSALATGRAARSIAPAHAARSSRVARRST